MIDNLIHWMNENHETVWLIIIGVATIRLDVLMMHIARTLDKLAAQAESRARTKRHANRKMMAHPINKHHRS